MPRNANPASTSSRLALYTNVMSPITVKPYPTSSQGLVFSVGNLDLIAATIPSYIRNFRLTMATGMTIKSPDKLGSNPASAIRIVAQRYRSTMVLSESNFISLSIANSTRRVRLSYFPHPMTEPFYRYKMTNNSWQGLLSLNGTLEEWVKKSDAEIVAIEEEILEIRELLDD